MTLEEIRKIDAQFRREKPRLFEFSTPDVQASEDQLAAVEAKVGFELPKSYRTFLKEFGGGSFGLTTIFSADPGSEWYLPHRQVEISTYLPEGLLPFSDDFAGGLYVLKTNGEKAHDQVFYWNQDGGLVPTEYKDIFEFVAKHAYEAA